MTIMSASLDLLAVIAPMTGVRATGKITFIGNNIPVPRNTVLIPIKDGHARTTIPFKVAEGPNADKSWTATALGAAVDVFSNIGGDRHNLLDGTEFIVDPPITGITSAIADGDFSNGANASGWGTVRDAVVYDQMNGPAFHVDLKRSMIKDFPAIILCWTGSDPSDGGTIKTLSRPGRDTVIFREQFQLAVVTNRSESEYTRREEALYILDAATEWLSTRKAVDGRTFADTEGVFIQRRYREMGPGELYKKYDVYGLVLTFKHATTRRDDREWNLWMHTVIDVTKPQDPALPNQGDYPVVTDMIVDMEQPS